MLKSLEVFGFKSFADRTRFEFAPGTTCVVGPNGSGKSNVVDAMKWLLGDQSPKSLRGKNMADVIFNGSQSRKPSGMAEATLTFDNSAQILDSPHAEVSITRRLYQGGDSEYLINGETSRLKDIRELFMGTGAATSAYSIIEQGRVGQVLQGNPSTRRILFDEAAGISRFKVRRIDAERKLERVSQNLLRLTDIVDEVETQLNAHRSQAGKATKYRELTRRLDAFWLGLAADDARRLTQELQTLQHEMGHLSAQVAETRTAEQAIETERERLRLEFTTADEQLQHVESQLSTLRQQRAGVQTSLKYQWDRATELEKESDRLAEQQALLRRRVREISHEIERVEQHRQAAIAELEQKRSNQAAEADRLAQLSQELQDLQAEQQRLQAERQMIREQISAAEKRQAHLQARQETLEQALARTAAEQQNAAATSEQTAAELAAAEDRYQQEATRYASQRKDWQQRRDTRQQLAADLQQVEQSLQQAREERTASEARLHLLEDMDRKNLGVSVGVQEILARAATATHPPWSCVIGMLPDLIECDWEVAPLVEIALGGGANILVVTELPPILHALEQRSTQFAGRLTFLELSRSTAVESPPDPRPLPDSAAAATSANQLVRCPPSLQPLIDELLGSIWLVERLSDARRILSTAPPGTRCLTPQGDLLFPDGRVETGTVHPENSVVSRRSEIRRLKNRLLQHDRDISRLHDAVSQTTQTMTEFDAALRETEQTLEAQNQELAEFKQQVAARRSACDLAEATAARIADDLATLQQELQTTVADRQRAQADLTRLQTELEEITAGLTQLHEAREATKQQQTAFEQDRNQFQLELAKLEERAAAAAQTAARFADDKLLREDQYREGTSRLAESQEKQRRLELQILHSEAQLAELFLISEHLADEVRRKRTQRTATQTDRDRLNEQWKELNQARRTDEERLQDCRIVARDLENELLALAEKVWEDNSYFLVDLVTADLSAYPAFLAEKEGRDLEPPEYPPRRSDTASNPAASAEDSSAIATMTAADDKSTSVEPDPGESTRGASTAEDSPAEHAQAAEQSSEADTGDEPAPPEGPAFVIADMIAEIEAAITGPSAWERADVDFLEHRPAVEREINRVRKKLKALGSVDPDSLQGLEEIEQRYEHLATQLQDLRHAENTLEEIIRKINQESRRIFVESFHTIRGHFQELFRELFGGGEGDVLMEDESDPLECGIEIVARPPGKELRSISLLSGGEKTMTAVGLLLAIFRSRPSPFCILDEVDAALDEANIDRFARVIGQFQDKTQFIVITHRKRTMTAADRIFGVTMEEAGISKRLTVRFEDVGENGEINVSGKSAA